MTTRELLLKEIQKAPEPLLNEVLDFIRSVQARLPHEGLATALASEAALGRDWLKPEEDAAWESL